MKNFSILKIKSRMVLLFLLTGICPILISGFVGTSLAKDALLNKSFEQMQAIQSIRAKQVKDNLQERMNSLKLLTEYDILMDLFTDLEDYRIKHSPAPDRDMDTSSEEYLNLIERYHELATDFISAFNYEDFYFISRDHGHILFSVLSKEDLGTSLEYGRYKNTSLSTLWKQVMKTGKMAIVDFEPYEADNNLQYAFVGVPVYTSEGVLQGVAALRIGTGFISSLLDSRQGMGNTGESYLLRWFEESNTFSVRSHIFSMDIRIGDTLDENLVYWEDAVNAGNAGGADIYTDSLGNNVLVSFSSMDIQGLDWYLISKINEEEVTAPLKNLVGHIVTIGLILMILTVFLALYIAKNITEPILKSKEFAWDIAHGNLDGVLKFETRKDELGELGESLNLMSRKLKEINWQRAGKEDMDDVLRGEWLLNELCDRFIRFFVDYFTAQMGAVYLKEEESDTLNLISSYAFTDRDGNFNRIKFGEGLIGQAALEKEPIYFNNISEDAPKLNYGVSEKIPPYFMITPLRIEGKTLGVFFIASISAFTEIQRSFISRNIENASILINMTKSRNLISILLQNTQEQGEELRVINEELEAQTNTLKESEEELQAQQEELRVTNEELEERTKALEQQTQSVSLKNNALVTAQTEIEKKAKDLEIASKYKSEFLANMSHELRTPLNSILILSQLFSQNKDGNLSERQIESAEAIHSSGSDLLKLINEILDLSKVEAGKIELNLEDMPFSDMVSDLKRVFKDLAEEKQINFTITLAPGVPSAIFTDSHRLQQVLRNLMTNAFKFTKEKGSVGILVDQPSKKAAQACGLIPSESVIIQVKDDGIGIPEDKQAAIFEAFQQVDGSTSRKYGGTGLGLSISRELSKLLGGNLTLESEVGKGSTFSIILPKHLLPKEEIEKKDTPTATEKEKEPETRKILDTMEVLDDRNSLSPQDKSLLIIEDDPRFIQILKDLAQERGFKCLIAEDGETGLHFADFYKPKAIILDIGLPGIDGWTVMERLKKDPELRHIPVHFMSGSDQSLEAMRMGAIGYLIKPVSIEKIENAFSKIERLISRAVRKLLIVEDDDIQRESIRQLIGEGDVLTDSVATGEEAFEKLSSDVFDCMVLDLGLEDMSGFELLEKIRHAECCSQIPVIIYTGRDLTKEEEVKLRKYSESIIIKGVKSPERLLDESALFLHRVESEMSPEKRKMLNLTHDQNAVFNNKKILLVDDDMRNVFALSSVLEEKNMNVIIAKNGLESLKQLENHSDIQLILMDIMMPEMDGYEAMRKIRKQLKYKKLPIIALTAKAMKGDRNKCIEAGASDYLAKPVNTDKLLSMLKVWLYES
ncbi:MAG: histidine kinase [Spirochaetaceae bacterium 4572_59]|nr:MAG: histidine kinase [Spirochaetaceae bacterium 4572_59]